MRKLLTFCISVTLAVVLALGPMLTLGAPVDKPVSDSPGAVARAFAPSREAATPARPTFSSKLLSRRPLQNDGSVAGQTTTLLPDGRLLKIGGLEDDGPVSAAIVDGSRIQLRFARAWHTSTMLPDGKILIVGGMGADGQAVNTAEIIDPETRTSDVLAAEDQRFSIGPRLYHTATLLTDGLVLISGGVSRKGDVLRTAQLWDFRTKTATTLRSKLKTARYNHVATLLADGKVHLSGGSDKSGASIESDELYDPQSQRFIKFNTEVDPDPQSLIPAPRLSASLPEDNASNVPVDALIGLRFTKLLQVKTVNTETVIMTGPYGRVEIEVVPAEGGMLAFITSKSPLFPGATYNISISGASDKSNIPLVNSSISFSTAEMRSPARGFDDEEWIPDTRSGQDDWQSKRPNSPWQSLPPLQAPPGVSALAGQALTLNGKPLANVTLKIDDKTAQTDNTGRFLLTYISAGHQELLINGRTASRGSKTYGVFEAGMAIKEGETNVLPYTIWMPRIDTAHSVTIPSPTTNEAVVTTPYIPGLEVHIPPNTVIYDEDKNSVTELSITPIPVDRPPFPLPAGVYVPIYFTVQPGTGYVKTLSWQGPKGARIIYPNYRDQSPGTSHNFWHYDPEERGWYVYGQGTVTDDGKQVVPNPGVAVYEFTGAMISPNGNPPADWPPPGGSTTAGDPVDLSTGLFVLNNTDLFLPDTIPLTLTRTYRSKDSAVRPFGIGSTHQYEMFLWSVTNYTEADLILPDGGRIHYVRISSGNNYFDAEYEHTATPTAFYKSRLKWNGAGWDLTLNNGTVYVFGDTTPLQSIRDRYGNKIIITRTNGQSGNITKISSPNGRWMEFSYDASNRVTQARDNTGRTVGYSYDGSGRLWKVTNSLNEITEYTYDASHRMLTIKDARGIVYTTNQYDANGRVSLQTQADATTYQFAYTLDGNGKVTQTDVTDPRGTINRVSFNGKGYLLTSVFAVGTSVQQTYSYSVETGTNLPLSVTDQLGRTTSFAYDSMGNITSITRLAGTGNAVTTSFTYEATFNQLASATDPLNHTVQFGYDSKGNITSVTDPLSNQATFAYNSAGHPITATNPLGKSMQFGYDAGDLVSVTSPLSQTVSRFIDSGGRLLSVTNPLGQTTRIEYDLLNRPTRLTDPLQGQTAYTYDANGNLLSVTDARSNAISYSYNNMDRVQTRTDPLQRNTAYVYDNNCNLSQMTDRKSQVTNYTYDALNRLTLVTYADSSTTGYTYDGGNRLTQIVDSISGTITYTYDNLDRLTSEATPQGTVSYTYDGAGRRATMSVPGQSTISYTYDNANRLTQIAQGSSTVSFTYDAASRVTTQTSPNGVVTEYSYDDASRLTSLTYKKGANVLGSLVYAYDSAGRRTRVGGSFASTGLPVAVATTSYNSANHQTGFGGQTLTYDNNGNLISDGNSTYTWNARNQLVSMSGPGLSASFQYDALGRRSGKTVNGVTTSYLYDGVNAVQEQSGGSPSANTLTGGIDQLFSRSDSSGTVGPLSDAIGSVIALTDSSGGIQTQYTFEPFGNTTQSGGASGNPSKYTGREDDGTGLYYYRARYYSPILQRFISEDPRGLSGGINVYAYVRNNPLSLRDPLGLKPHSNNGDGTSDEPLEDPDDPWAGAPPWLAAKGTPIMWHGKPHFKWDGGVFDTGGNLVGSTDGTDTDWGMQIAMAAPFAALVDLAPAAAVPAGGALAKTGLTITGHAADQMAVREITTSMIEAALRKGIRLWDPKNKTVIYWLENGFASGKSLMVSQDIINGAIVTVLRTSKGMRTRWIRF